MNIIGIDIGGTKIKYAKVKENGEILEFNSLLTECSKGKEQIIEKIFSIVDKLKDKNTKSVGVSVTGLVANNEIVGGKNIVDGWIGTNFKKILEKRYNLPVKVENDANCAAIGEGWIGVAKDLKDYICITIGTGIGGGIVINKELYKGSGSIAGEFGFIPMKNSSFQELASTKSLLEKVNEKIGISISGEEFFSRKLKEKAFVEIYDSWIENLAEGISILLYILNPKVIVLSGGVTSQGEMLKKDIIKNLMKKNMPMQLKDLEIKIAKNGDFSGILGVVYLAKK